jgi:two-component system, OmpR family, alkaline phosphatase synthesis response regulator PhoP
MGKLVFVVDNAEPIRDVLGKTIQELYKTEVAAGALAVRLLASGHDLLLAAALETPDLVLLDVDMPDLDGIETFYRLRQAFPQIAGQVVFLTGFAGAQAINARLQRAIADGAWGYLPKPATIGDLKQVLDARLFPSRS